MTEETSKVQSKMDQAITIFSKQMNDINKRHVIDERMMFYEKAIEKDLQKAAKNRNANGIFTCYGLMCHYDEKTGKCKIL